MEYYCALKATETVVQKSDSDDTEREIISPVGLKLELLKL